MPLQRVNKVHNMSPTHGATDSGGLARNEPGKGPLGGPRVLAVALYSRASYSASFEMLLAVDRGAGMLALM